MLNLTGISKTYPGEVHPMQDIHLDVPRGMFGLRGPNGAGNSLLMRTIATLQQPDSGAITFNEIDILQDKTALRCSRTSLMT
jgi:ABC-2 type transport system ATP-binding protein